MYTISKEFTFSAAHSLSHLSTDHPCSKVHGHNYTVIVELSTAKPDAKGFVVDYRDLEPMKKFIDKILDHKNLNDILPFPTTVENIAEFLYNVFICYSSKVSAVTVKETDKTAMKFTTDHNERNPEFHYLVKTLVEHLMTLV